MIWNFGTFFIHHEKNQSTSINQILGYITILNLFKYFFLNVYFVYAYKSVCF